ncbi:MAG: sugar transferase [Actinobacteria bacterium]|nr:sugar transferase [Actinomycetota bacterium]
MADLEGYTGEKLRGGSREAADGSAKAHARRLPRLGPLRATLLHPLLEGRGWTFVRVGSDALALSLTVALVAWTAVMPDRAAEGTQLLWAYPVLTIALLSLRELYRADHYVPLLDAVAHIAGAAALTAMLLIAFVGITDPEARPAYLVGPVWLGGTLALIAGHVSREWARRRARERHIGGKATLIVGAGRVGAKLERRLRAQPQLGLNPIGFLGDESAGPSEDGGPSIESPVLGHPSKLKSVVRAKRIEHVILAILPMPDSSLLPLIRDCEALGVGVSVVPRCLEMPTTRVALTQIGGLPLFELRRVDPKSWQFAVKHMLDRVAASIILLALAPLMVAIVLAVKLSSPGPIFFRQTRIGRDDAQFDMLKFRTMGKGDPADAGFEVQPDRPPSGVEGVDRRTRIGTLLRRTSLDELPQLLNVLRGDMSLVGPRPKRPQVVPQFGENLERCTDRHRVKSGITGWAQVRGLRGQQTSLNDRVEWDNYYIENWSLWLDVKILLMTSVAIATPAE